MGSTSQDFKTNISAQATTPLTLTSARHLHLYTVWMRLIPKGKAQIHVHHTSLNWRGYCNAKNRNSMVLVYVVSNVH